MLRSRGRNGRNENLRLEAGVEDNLEGAGMHGVAGGKAEEVVRREMSGILAVVVVAGDAHTHVRDKDSVGAVVVEVVVVEAHSYDRKAHTVLLLHDMQTKDWAAAHYACNALLGLVGTMA